MNGRKAKQLRREAERKSIEWYRDLLSPEESDKLTDKEVLGYVVKNDHVVVDGQVKISEGTLRKFYKVEKQNESSHT